MNNLLHDLVPRLRMYGAIPASPIPLQAVVSNEAKGVLIF